VQLQAHVLSSEEDDLMTVLSDDVSVMRRGTERSAKAKNVILMIGDGMGPVQRQAARLTNGRYGLTMESLPISGLVRTSCADPEALVTDSAAAATALATGTKTRNGVIGLDPNGLAVSSILEIAKTAGKAVGLVTTCQITDATPAAFAAHVPERSDHSEIARQFIEEAGVDVILGGGADWWHPVGMPRLFPSHPLDDPAATGLSRHGDLIARARDYGYATALLPNDLRNESNRKVLGLLANQELFRQSPEGQGDHYDPPMRLAELTSIAIQTLCRHPEGFFLMVEEAAVDRMGHYNNAPLAIKAVHELDRAVGVAKRYAQDEAETLLIVTADHECGGFCIDGDFMPDEIRYTWKTTGHTATNVPLNAIGPGADALEGEYENTHVFTAMTAAFGLG
jgi:alkaline phosphatase